MKGKSCLLIIIPAVLFLLATLSENLLAGQDGITKTSLKPLPPQSETGSQPRWGIQNLSPTTTDDPQLDKAAFARKTKKLQIPFIANNGQVDDHVRFYAKTFGGTVFVTKDGDIVYSLPMVAHASPLVHYDIDKNETGRTGLTGFPGKEGRCIVHRTLCTMYPYCTWNFAVHYSETNSLLCNTESNFPVCHSERSEESYLNNSQSVPIASIVETQCLASLMHSPNGNSPLGKGTHPLIPSREGNGVCSTTPTTRRDTERRVPTTTVALKEQFVGAKVKTIQGEQPSVTKVNYFKGNDPEKWKTDISTYDFVNLGEIYKGIDLKLKAYGDNVEKLFYVKPGANPEQIKIRLSGLQLPENPPPLSPSVRGTGGCPPLAGAGGGAGARGLWVNENGELVAETELGPVKFTKPVAYQEIDGERVYVDVEYDIQKTEARMRNQAGKRQISSREKGMGRKGAYLTFNSQHLTETLQPETQNPQHKTDKSNPKSEIQNVEAEVSNPKSKITNRKFEYGFIVASYDRTKDLIIDPLLASTYLGGSNEDRISSLALDTGGNVYVMGRTWSTDFPTTSGAYDTSFNGGSYDTYVSKLESGLTSLLASTYLGGSSDERGDSLTFDTSGNVYVTGYTYSTDFPTTIGAYDTSYNGDNNGRYFGYGGDVFVSKLNSGLTSLLASTYLGGSGEDFGRSLTLVDTSGNVYVMGGDSFSRLSDHERGI